MKMRKRTTCTILVLTALAITSACSDKEDRNSENKGTLKILLTDAPFPSSEVSQVNVTIDQVAIKQSDDTTTTDIDESGFEILSNQTASYNLLDLRNGTVATLASIDTIAAGTYTEIRLRIVDATIVLTDGTELALKIPSGNSSGLKIKIDGGLTVRGGNTSALILDFDVSRSFVVTGRNPHSGAIKGFIFKPVIRATAEDISGTLEGTVTDSATKAAVNGAFIRVIRVAQQDTMTVLTNASGYYALIGVLPDSYKVIASYEGFANDTIESAVVETNKTSVADFELHPVAQTTGSGN